MKQKLIALLFLGILILGVFQIQSVLSDPSTNPASSNNVSSAQDFTPVVNIPSNVDTNHNGIVDSLDQEIARKGPNGPSPQYIDVIVMLKTQPKESDTAIFIENGGILTTTPWSFAFYGFGGQISYDGITTFVEQCPDVLLIEKGGIANGSVAYAAKQVGARPYVWNTLGLQGDPNSSIAVLDSGIDGSHLDFAPGYGDKNFQQKIVGWNNQVTSSTTPVDDNGHGSHCSGLAAGDGFFSVDSTGRATATWGGDLTGVSTGVYPLTGMMVNKTGLITITVKWSSTGTARLNAFPLYYGDKTLTTSSWVPVAYVDTPNQNTWYTLTYNVGVTPSGGYDMYHPAVNVTSGTGNFYVVFNMSWPYTPPVDGFSAWTGMAPQSKLVGIKVLNNVGSGTSAQFISGINWLIANRVAYHITVASMSLVWGNEQVAVDSALVNLVNSGVAAVVAAGNSGSGGNYIYTPGSVDEVTTVAAMNQFDSISSYSSQGGTSHSTGYTMKPDITAPGGSFYAAPLFSVDSNYNDADGGFSEVRLNDSAPMQGTSMATPIVAGAEQIIVQAMGGYNSWSYTRSQALKPKMLLLMTATETYPNLREMATSSYSPTLDRGTKDAHEGFGRMNVDAATDAILKTYQVGTVISDNLGNPPKLTNISVLGQRLAWARNVQLIAGAQYNFSLSVPSGADYDLYLYNTTGNAYGEPIFVAKSTTAANGGFEKISYTPNLSGQFYIIVKLAREDTGIGQFTLTSTVSPDNWSMFHHDLQHNGYSTSTGPSTSNTLWIYNATTVGNHIQSSPAIVNDRVYVGSWDDRVYCLDANSGAPIWSYTTGNDVLSSPAVSDGKVYVGSRDKNVYCLNATSGAPIWVRSTGNLVESSPAVSDGKVYIGSYDYKVYCLDANSGGSIWSYTTGGYVLSSPAVCDGKVYIGSNDKNVYCLNAVSGGLIWSSTTGGSVGSSPAVSSGRVYVGSGDGKVYCFNAFNGALIWSYTIGAGTDSSPAVSSGRVFVGASDGKVYCLDAASGIFGWSYATGNNVHSSPAVSDGKVYVGSADYKVYCLNAVSGAFVWSYTTGSFVHSSPAVSDSKVYVGSSDGGVYCFGLPASITLTGGTVSSGGSGYTTPHVVLVGGGGSGATATARVSQGVIFGVVLTNPGSGYTSPPTITFRDPSPRAKGAIATIDYINP